ncbi:BBLF2/BBLF3 linker [Phascolarctid gammaherpesvirus 1]|uniref:BBLF2/BBLF3 linker n=1 Tax=Phascolarctid gammaherpesvirus 1 TaxID=2249313 RepID=A0A3S5HA17_9GAMA|nr:BBLF2/BBLF3 linker [Phascolarctid gammaherpesvirus 1]AZB49211.1 BBLF2/BBLF3 linker [Phascolarctid gammaherpesvirus 1]
MEEKSEKVVTITAIHFYSWIKVCQSNYAIYHILYRESEHRRFCFYLYEIPVSLSPPPPGQSVDPTAWIRDQPLLIWELRLTLSNPLLLDLSKHNYPTYRITIQGHVLLRATRCIKTEPYTPIPGYLYCDTKIEAIKPPHSSPLSKNWHSQLSPTVNITELSVCLKTREGVFLHTTCPEEPPKSRQRQETLPISDIFRTEDVRVHCPTDTENTYTLRAILPKMDILWINEASIYNGGPVIFFNSLFDKLYGGFKGIRPLRSYIFPMGIQEGSPFNAHYPGFPFIRMEYGHPNNQIPVPLHGYEILIPYLYQVSESLPLQRSLLHGSWNPRLERECLTKCSFIDFVNEDLAINDTMDNKLTTVHLKDINILIQIDILEALVPHRLSSVLPYILHMCSSDEKAIFWKNYYSLVEAISYELHQSRCLPILIKETTIIFYMPLTDTDARPPELIVPHLDTRLKSLDSNIQLRLYTQTEAKLTFYDSILIHTLNSNHISLIPKSWLEAIQIGASTMHCGAECEAQDALTTILPQLISKRRDPEFWFLPTPLQVTAYPAPRIPIDCLNCKNTYLWTQSGTVFWSKEWPLPGDMDYGKYLIEILGTLKRLETTYTGTWRMSETEKRTIKSICSILNLL